jgi:hypothetical protein
LVLILAAAPSHATERRDPILTPNSAQNPGPANREVAAKPSKGSGHAKKSSHPAQRAHVNSTESNVNPAVKKSKNDSQMGTSSGTK